uniref:PPM-type phosphatase domain-containing protein n=1 Tax=Erythrolobus madagascarensis TaxID=708628 RepID=A0A7S0XK41_9RHOD|mmetsp:Transcript_67/g.106  ORF Transcript_67/g.106 Transcript_67/m.106 type:complete len:286 (+) Transcript_67:167-1024(+)
MGIFDVCFGGSEVPRLKRGTAMITKMGEMHQEANVPNQDFGIAEELGSGEDAVLVACVFDGHGDDGHEISKLAAKLAGDEIRRLHGRAESDVMKMVSSAFRVANRGVDDSQYSRTSGCTGSIVVVRGKDLAVGNVGDSTVVLMANRKSSYYPRWVSTDHRLDEPAERQRIVENGGIIYEEQYVVDKVEKNKGLMVTRTMGDVDMRPNGVLSDPELKRLTLNDASDRLLVVASDGLWDEDGVSFQFACSVSAKAARRDLQAVPKELLKAIENYGPADDCTICAVAL